jgi:dienelactone hydrolase
MQLKSVFMTAAWSRSWLLSAALLMAPPAPAQPSAQAAPAEHFVKPRQLHSVVPSPSGKRVAMIATAPSGRKVAAVMPLEGPSEPKIVAAFADANVEWIGWVNDDRVVFEAAQPGIRIDRDGAGAFAVDADGENLRQLTAFRTDNMVTGSRIETRMLNYEWSVWGTVDDGSGDVLVARRGADAQGYWDQFLSRLARLDTHTGAMKEVATDVPQFVSRWILDAKAQVRVVAVTRDGRQRLFWRMPGRDAWKLVLDEPQLGQMTIEPLYLENERTLIVEARRAGQDTSALFEFDLHSAKMGEEPLVALKGFDIEAKVEYDSQTRRVVGVHARAAQPLSAWFDARLQAVQRAVDTALPGRINRLRCGRCESTNQFIVESRSDRHPGEFLHYDHQRRTLRGLGKARPWLEEATQGRRSFHRVGARDGLSLPLVMTHPAAHPPAASGRPTPLPAVVLVHGGPWLRGADTTWSAEAQFLASRGYRVIEVEFRGSTGFGWRHFAAGLKQWGTTMQDDLVDAVRWAADEGWVDASRVCLYGGSYGGYASLMAPIRHPKVFRCAASVAGVTDIGLMYTASWGDFTEQTKRYTLPELVGDPKADEALLAASSPLKRIEELKIPVLLAYGGLDRRVPPEHAERFLNAARRAEISVERVFYPHEGHGWSSSANHADFLSRLETFLARHLLR